MTAPRVEHLSAVDLRRAIAMRLDGMSIEGIAAELGRAAADVLAALDGADPHDIWRVMDAVCALEPEPWPAALFDGADGGPHTAKPVIGARRYRPSPLPPITACGAVSLGEPLPGRSALDMPREDPPRPSIAIGRRPDGNPHAHANAFALMCQRRARGRA